MVVSKDLQVISVNFLYDVDSKTIKLIIKSQREIGRFYGGLLIFCNT